MSKPPEDDRDTKQRISVLLARSREARARALRVLEKARALRERSGDIHEDISALVARSNRLARRPALREIPDD